MPYSCAYTATVGVKGLISATATRLRITMSQIIVNQTISKVDKYNNVTSKPPLHT